MGTSLLSFHCTTCPNDCALSVKVDAVDDTPRVLDVTGNRCPRGVAFARQEITCPVRVLATTILVEGGDEQLLPVRTAEAIPRALHLSAMETLRHLSVSAPITMGDVVLENLLDTGVDVIASLDVAAA